MVSYVQVWLLQHFLLPMQKHLELSDTDLDTADNEGSESKSELEPNFKFGVISIHCHLVKKSFINTIFT
jgi:hypothetical protein